MWCQREGLNLGFRYEVGALPVDDAGIGRPGGDRTHLIPIKSRALSQTSYRSKMVHAPGVEPGKSPGFEPSRFANLRRRAWRPHQDLNPGSQSSELRALSIAGAIWCATQESSLPPMGLEGPDCLSRWRKMEFPARLELA